MAIKYVVVHRKDPNNVGDIASNPLQYFLKPDEYQTVDISDIGNVKYNTDVPLIAGGGGLINNALFGDKLRDLLGSPDREQLMQMWTDSWVLSNLKYQNIYDEFNDKYKTLVKETIDKIPNTTNVPKIIWGAGTNADADGLNSNPPKYPKWLVDYTLIGTRDYHPSSKVHWVPCASCMHPALRKTYAIKNDVIFFEHKKQLLKGSEFGTDPIPRFINSGDNIDQTIELLGSSNIILTNSYHGAYWGTLLKKKVILVGSWSSKFSYLKHQPYAIGKKETWRDVIDKTTLYPLALDECTATTENYWKMVKGLR